MNAKLVPEKGP